jgi:hypothetical protein
MTAEVVEGGQEAKEVGFLRPNFKPNVFSLWGKCEQDLINSCKKEENKCFPKIMMDYNDLHSKLKGQ